jgi:hypothetical protein
MVVQEDTVQGLNAQSAFWAYCAQDYRIDHNIVTYSSAYDMFEEWGYAAGNAYGLFDHNTVTYGRIVFRCEVVAIGPRTKANGTAPTVRPLTAGCIAARPRTRGACGTGPRRTACPTPTRTRGRGASDSTGS